MFKLYRSFLLRKVFLLFNFLTETIYKITVKHNNKSLFIQFITFLRPLLSREEKEQQIFLSIFLLCYVQESVLATKRHSNCYKTNLIKSLWWNLFLSLLLLLPVPSSFFKKNSVACVPRGCWKKKNNFAIILVRGKRKTVEKQFNHFLMEFQCF